MTRQLPYSDLTLEEALDAFRKENNLEAKYRDMREEAQTHFERHDIIHVLFGLDTSIRQEAQADGWTLFGTDISLRHIREFFDLPEEKELIEDIGWWEITKAYFRGIPDYFRIAWQSRKLRKKWRWSDHAAYRSRRVGEIRQEFGIKRALAG
ncbi:hypothetical protein [uncultured Erythrobacter sp.]|uniref:hypothetical protein n=1 Tax=uncultured Erythrobacter sp. TaxID=263913 RepID=UPI00262E0D71|nr:hypothetical protein [uncultured Erythrobacter sp.]